MAIPLDKKIKRVYRRITGFLFARYFFAKVFIGFIASTIIFITFLTSAFDKFELVTLDQRFRMRPDRPTSREIVFIEMAEDSIEAIGRWPWPREWHATLVTILSKYDAKSVIFDVIFDRPSSEMHDLVFSEAIGSAGSVYLPFVFQFYKGDRIIENAPDGNVRNILLPLKIFQDKVKSTGHVNVVPDIDGTLRRVPLLIKYKDRYYPQVSFKVVQDYLGLKEDDITVIPGKKIMLGNIEIPVDRHNQMLVNWAGTWKDTFKHYSYIDIIVSYRQILNGEKPIIDLNELKDKICIIGLTASGLYDIRPIPLEASYPVVGINANIINSILNNDFIKRVPAWVDMLLIYLMGLLLSLIVSRARFMRGAVYTFVTLVGYIITALLIFTFTGRWIVVIYPSLAMFFTFLGVTLYHEVILSFEKKKYFDLSIRDGLTRLFNIRYFKELLAKEFELSSGKRRMRGLSLIMADVDHFKKFNDTYGHQVGDFVLKRVARVLKGSSRGHDIVARYGGEEFIMMLPATDIEAAKRIAERIRETIEKKPFIRNKETYHVTISLGVAMLGDEPTKEDFIKSADEALYEAKRTGRNRVCVK